MVTDEQISNAAQRIKDGQLVAFPTETVYGLGANALDPEAVAGIFELKGRPRFDPLIVHVCESIDIGALVESVPPLAQQLMDKFWPGPVSMIFKKKPSVPDIVTAGMGSVAIRFPRHDVAQRLIRAAGVPISAPSANRFGMISPTTAQHVADQFGPSLHCLDGGPCQIGVESTVLSFLDSDSEPQLLRHGGITQEQVEEVTGPIRTHIHQESQPTSPGQLSRHYSPRTPMVIARSGVPPESMVGDAEKVGLLSLLPYKLGGPFFASEVLSETGDFREAAANLFAAMRRLDAMDLDLIVAEAVPENGLGRAIMDRLNRAAAK